MADQLGLTGKILEDILGQYFTIPHSDHRQIPGGIFIFKGNIDKLLGQEKDHELRSKLRTLYDEYSKGWRFDGEHEDLGPVNGPLPLQELIKVNYLYTMEMLGRRAAKARQQNETETQGFSPAELETVEVSL